MRKKQQTPESVLTRELGSTTRICQLNVEGLSSSKSQFLSKFLVENNVDVAVLQETHIENLEQQRSRGKIHGYDLLGAIYHRHYGLATYVRSSIENAALVSLSADCFQQIVTKIGELTVVNIYKPPQTDWPQNVIETHPHPTICAGDFNSHHTDWKYRTTDINGEKLSIWAEENHLHLVFDAKDKNTFKSAIHNTETNPDLSFTTRNSQSHPIPTRRKIQESFPHSQHRPILLEIGINIPLIRSLPRPRWNLQKANWDKFSNDIDQTLRWIPARWYNYDRFVNIIIAAAKRYIPRGYRKEYIPGWNEETEELHQRLLQENNAEIADELLRNLDVARRKRWEETTEALNFTKSSRKAWNLLRKLGDASAPEREVPGVSPNQIASRIVSLSRAPRDKKSTIFVKRHLKSFRQSEGAPNKISRSFIAEEVNTAISKIKKGKAPGFDGVLPEFLIHSGRRTREWLSQFFSHIMQTGVVPPVFKKAKIISLLRPGKPKDKPESYRPISLLSTTYKLLEWLILGRIEPILEEHLPVEQAGFRHNRGCEDQVLSVTSHIEAGFQQRLKTTVAFVDLTAAYDTVWKDGLLYKLYRTIPCQKLLRIFNNMLRDRTFQIIMGD